MGNEAEEQEDKPHTPSKENSSPPIADGPSCGHTNGIARSRRNGIVGEGQRCMAWRVAMRLLTPKPYFSKVSDVIERVLEKNNETEAIAADAYTELVGSKSLPSSPSRKTREKIDLCAWKDERIHYNKSSSRVGPEFQVSTLPKAGSGRNPTNHTDAQDGGAL
jgi:hypothetical protein